MGTSNILLKPVSRRDVLRASLATVPLVLAPSLVHGFPHILKASKHEKTLWLHNTHTGEKLKTLFWANGHFIQENLLKVNHILRDHRTGHVISINPKLLSMLHRIVDQFGPKKAIDIISGYRSPRTNARLHQASHGVAKNSQHTKGNAIDIRVSGVSLKKLRDAAMAEKMGGVGYYPHANFIHIDVRGKLVCW